MIIVENRDQQQIENRTLLPFGSQIFLHRRKLECKAGSREFVCYSHPFEAAVGLDNALSMNISMKKVLYSTPNNFEFYVGVKVR